MVFFLILAIVLGGLAWIRLAPSDPAVWNVDPQVTADQDLSNGVRRRIWGGAETLQALNAIILATPRTDVLVGTPEDAQITYVTRSKWMGFPDYTTVKAEDGVIELYARARFGQSDMGVNHERVESWLEALRAREAAAEDA
ncbi:DUF1499 domain-containing protein [Ponticoccus alexandrii]|uniref:DUF1499 domain-containing protein n=1 Tax=Ponticoccus alexandrii TaxID=1943633 RepID=A0ABX7F7J9_9RHOB|nr:DUF1499 domain-containing protein [Ponticoccus alexandrii]ETA52028.1 hypothetical protein P279_10905 [Rhodobacteraceae bacterium PD-2]QRF66242.1 DUF1499 domain-containing protein [Ponticoccus alexandrii]